MKFSFVLGVDDIEVQDEEFRFFRPVSGPDRANQLGRVGPDPPDVPTGSAGFQGNLKL